MALTSLTTDAFSNYKVTTGTLSGGDDAFTFDIQMRRFWVSTPAAVVNLYFAAVSSGHSPFAFPVAASTEYRMDGLANRTVALKGTNTQVISIVEELKAAAN